MECEDAMMPWSQVVSDNWCYTITPPHLLSLLLMATTALPGVGPFPGA